MKKNNRFAKGSGVYTCSCCGKRTRKVDADSADLGICFLCYDAGGWENEHRDMHDGNFQECEECKNSMDDKTWKHIQDNPTLFLK